MKPFFAERSLHTWLGTLGSIISIIGFVFGVQTLHQIESVSLSGLNISWGQPSLGLTIAMLILSLIFVWGAYWIITTTIIAWSRTSILLSNISSTVFVGLGIAIGIWNYDAFFDIRSMFLSSADQGDQGFSSFLNCLLLGPIICFALPLWVVFSANETASEWGCRNCGKIALENTNIYDTERSEEETYMKDSNGIIASVRLEKFQNYVVQRKCRNCGFEWEFKKRELLGAVEHSLEDER